jgi:hypothetical protein
MALLALHEVGHESTQFVCDGILNGRLKKGTDKGAWYGQGINHCHPLAAACGLFACLKARPSCVRDIQTTAQWLLKRQDENSGGWGYHVPEPRGFYTAYALWSLSEFSACARKAGVTVAGLESSVEKGVDFLLNIAPRSANPDGILLWSKIPGQSDLCLATSVMAIHALARMRRAKSDRLLVSALKKTIDLLSQPLQDGPSLEGSQLSIQLGGEAVRFDAWPRFLENGPNYWHLYFHPIATTTLLDSEHDLGIPETPRLRQGLNRTVEWIIQRSVPQTDGFLGVSIMDGEGRIAIWPTVLSVIVLSRWLGWFKSTLVDPQVLPQLRVSTNRLQS